MLRTSEWLPVRSWERGASETSGISGALGAWGALGASGVSQVSCSTVNWLAWRFRPLRSEGSTTDSRRDPAGSRTIRAVTDTELVRLVVGLVLAWEPRRATLEARENASEPGEPFGGPEGKSRGPPKDTEARLRSLSKEGGAAGGAQG